MNTARLRAVHAAPAPVGLYVLTGNGALGVYDDNKRFTIDAELTKAFADHNTALLKSYLKNPDDGRCRIGVVYGGREGRLWKGATMVMEEPVVRNVYPVTGAAAGQLTAFQKRHQTQSVYRGMEVMLGGAEADTASAMYCPVLFDRHTTLDQYLILLGREQRDTDRKTPVLEVLNLAAILPTSAGNQSAIVELRAKLRASLIKSELRKASELTILDKVEWQDDGMDPGAYGDVDKRHFRRTVLPVADIDRLHSDYYYEEVERWLPQPPRPVGTTTLHDFAQFRDLDDKHLGTLASNSFIYEAPPGTRLVQHGMTDEWNMYLLSGSVTLQAEDGAVIVVEGNTPKAESPISFLKPRKYTVETLTPVSFLWIHNKLLDAVLSGDPA